MPPAIAIGKAAANDDKKANEGQYAKREPFFTDASAPLQLAKTKSNKSHDSDGYAQEKQDVSDLVDVVKMYEDKEIPYDPSEDGFVFSQTQIDEGILARNREELIEVAYDHRLESAAA